MARFIKNILSKLFGANVQNKGKNNLIKQGKDVYFRKTKIKIFGNNNTIEIKDKAYLHNVTMQIGFKDSPINNCHITIGEKTSFNGCSIFLGESNSFVEIGNECMFSFNVELTCSDTHSILDLEDNLINRGESIIIGNKNWICKNTTFMKNTQIGNNCIVAQNSTVTKKFNQDNCIMGGVPAKIIKENIKWDKARPEKYIK